MVILTGQANVQVYNISVLKCIRSIFPSASKFFCPLQQNQTILEKIISEIENGWTPAIADSAEKLEHIRQGLKLLTDYKSFWIGGSAKDAGIIEYSQYMVDETGK